MDFFSSLKNWLVISWRIIVQPTTKMFETESQKSTNKFDGPVSALILFAIYMYLTSSINIKGFMPISVLEVVIFVVSAAVLIFTLSLYFMYQAFFKKGAQSIYFRLFYIVTAILSSIQIIYLPVALFVLNGVTGILNFAVWLYQFFLVIVAFRAICKLNYWQSTFSVIGSLFITFTVLHWFLPHMLKSQWNMFLLSFR